MHKVASRACKTAFLYPETSAWEVQRVGGCSRFRSDESMSAISSSGRRQVAHAVQASAWPRCLGAHVPNKAPVPLPSGQAGEDHTRAPEQLSSFGSYMKAALSSICEAVIQAAPELDALDAKYVPPMGHACSSVISPLLRGRHEESAAL